MKVITSGYKYFVQNFLNNEVGQEIQFVENDRSGNNINDGTTNEEVIKALIARLSYLNERFSCSENEQAIIKLKEALMWLNARTESRILRGVEGKKVV